MAPSCLGRKDENPLFPYENRDQAYEATNGHEAGQNIGKTPQPKRNIPVDKAFSPGLNIQHDGRGDKRCFYSETIESHPNDKIEKTNDFTGNSPHKSNESEKALPFDFVELSSVRQSLNNQDILNPSKKQGLPEEESAGQTVVQWKRDRDSNQSDTPQTAPIPGPTTDRPYASQPEQGLRSFNEGCCLEDSSAHNPEAAHLADSPHGLGLNEDKAVGVALHRITVPRIRGKDREPVKDNRIDQKLPDSTTCEDSSRIAPSNGGANSTIQPCPPSANFQSDEETSETELPAFTPKTFSSQTPRTKMQHGILAIRPAPSTPEDEEEPEETSPKTKVEGNPIDLDPGNGTEEYNMHPAHVSTLARPDVLGHTISSEPDQLNREGPDKRKFSRRLSSIGRSASTTDRGRPRPMITDKQPQWPADEISTAPSKPGMLNRVVTPLKLHANDFAGEPADWQKETAAQGTVPSLRSIVITKYTKLIRNVYKAYENVAKRKNLGSCGKEDLVDQDRKCSKQTTSFKEPKEFADNSASANVPTPTKTRCNPSKYTDACDGKAQSFCRRPLAHMYMVRIIHEKHQDQDLSDYQWDETAVGQEPAACYFMELPGVSETQLQSRIKLLEVNLDSFFPSYRRWRYGEKAARRVEFYTVSRGQKRVSFQRVCNIDVRGRDYGQCEVYESKIHEVLQFVDVTQPRPGIISDIASDPPGQQSVYIPPGDHRKETYRLSTFESFPKQTPINVPGLAKYGFFYTGFYDRVKCYSCGRTVEKWAPGDDPSDNRWHKQDCLLARGLMNDNIPIGGRFSSGLINASSSGASAPQPMEVGQSLVQNFNGPVSRGVDVTDLTRSGGTYQMLPNSTFVIGPTSVHTHQAPLPVRQPANNPQAARNPPRQWRMANVISADHKRHLTNLYLNRELDRLASFGRWPTGRPNVAPVELARAGFFYLGDMDRTQCYSCGGVLRNWSADDDAMVEHRTHFPSCRIIAGVERRNVPVPQQAETPMELAEKFPCRFPMNPHMRSEQSRLATFDRRWPADRTRAQPQEIAEAGFFFLGERDRVKCWYCNGGLQNWEYDDVPWIEHAKWFPNCQFLLAKQGQLFVYRYLSLSPHLPRPIIGRQDGASVDPSTATLHSGQASGSQDVAPAPASRVQAPSPPPAIIDPQKELRKREERVEKDLKESDTVKVVLAMGYAENLVRRTLLEKLEAGQAHDADNIFEGTAALLDAVMEKEGELERERDEEQATSIKFPTMSSNYSALTAGSMDTSPSGPPSGVHQVSGFDDDDEDRDLYSSIAEGTSSGAVGGATSGPASFASETKLQQIWQDIPEDQESMKEFIEQKKEERLCKICFVETADMVFIPCSHMCCCMSCTEAIRHCPICRKKIEKAIKTYVK